MIHGRFRHTARPTESAWKMQPQGLLTNPGTLPTSAPPTSTAPVLPYGGCVTGPYHEGPGGGLGDSLASKPAGRRNPGALGQTGFGWVALLLLTKTGPTPTYPPQFTVSIVYTLHPPIDNFQFSVAISVVGLWFNALGMNSAKSMSRCIPSSLLQQWVVMPGPTTLQSLASGAVHAAVWPNSNILT